MINLLPSQQKEELFQEEKLKLVLIFGMIFIVFLLSLILIFLSIKISISRDLEIQKMFLEEKEKEISLNRELEEKIKNSNLALSKLNSFYQSQLNLTGILEKISATLPSGTYLTNLNLIRAKEKSAVLILLSGFSPNREVLLSFKENLENEKDFFEIDFPPENWVKPTDINFNVTFKLIKK